MSIKKKQTEVHNLRQQKNNLQMQSATFIKKQTAEEKGLSHTNKSFSRPDTNLSNLNNQTNSSYQSSSNSHSNRSEQFNFNNKTDSNFNSSNSKNKLQSNDSLTSDFQSNSSSSNSNEKGLQKQPRKHILSSPLTSNTTASNMQVSNVGGSSVNDLTFDSQTSSNFNSSSSNSNLKPSNLMASNIKRGDSNNQASLSKKEKKRKQSKKHILNNQVGQSNSNNVTDQSNNKSSSVVKNRTTKLLKKGAKKYKEELEKGDVGVEVSGQSITATRRTIKFSRQAFQKLKQRQMDVVASVKVKKTNTSKNFIKKGIVVPATSTVKKGANSYQTELEKGDVGVEVTNKGLKLAKQGATQLNLANKKLQKEKTVINIKKSKLRNASLKLKKQNDNVQKVVTSKKLQKKAIKTNLISKNHNRLLNSIVGVFGNTKNTLLNATQKISFMAFKKMILGKITLAIGSSTTALLPVLLVIALVLSLGFIGSLFGEYQKQVNGTIGVAQNLSPEVEQWRSLVTQEATAQGMENYIDLILAIIQVESGGRGPDIMQSSESAGHPPNYFQTELESIRQGISYLKSIITILQGYGMGYENNARLIAQSYNFGSPFARYVGNRGGDYDLTFAEEYSRTIVAPSLGNITGETYSYVNSVSKSFNKTYLYRNGGNFFYGELVGQYIGRPSNLEGDFATVMTELEKYNGWEYVWGGKSPTSGFDCSGLIAWGLKQIGISLPSPAANQYAMTVPISESEAQPGDLIFFRGTYGSANHISHVAFYIDSNTMYDANGSGVGYHNWKSSYWQSHKPEIRRIVQ